MRDIVEFFRLGSRSVGRFLGVVGVCGSDILVYLWLVGYLGVVALEVCLLVFFLWFGRGGCGCY